MSFWLRSRWVRQRELNARTHVALQCAAGGRLQMSAGGCRWLDIGGDSRRTAAPGEEGRRGGARYAGI